jgi:hypothetical protein
MPQNEKVTFPEGTGGFAVFWAIPVETDEAIPTKITTGRRKRRQGSFMIVQIIALSLEA